MFFWTTLGAKREPNFQEVLIGGICDLFAISVKEKTGISGCEVCMNSSGGKRRLSEVRNEEKHQR